MSTFKNWNPDVSTTTSVPCVHVTFRTCWCKILWAAMLKEYIGDDGPDEQVPSVTDRLLLGGK